MNEFYVALQCCPGTQNFVLARKLFALNVCNTIFQVFEQNKRSVHKLLNRRRKLKSVWQEGIKNPRLIDLAYGTSTHTRTHTRPGTRPPAGQGSALITTMPWLHVPATHISLSWPGKLFDYASKVKRLANISVHSRAESWQRRRQRQQRRRRRRWRWLWKLLPSKIAT